MELFLLLDEKKLMSPYDFGKKANSSQYQRFTLVYKRFYVITLNLLQTLAASLKRTAILNSISKPFKQSLTLFAPYFVF